MAIEDYETATNEELQVESAEVYRTQKLNEIDEQVKQDFYEARDIAFKALEDQYQADRDALTALWAAGEPTFTIPK
jgi:hypothetical protein